MWRHGDVLIAETGGVPQGAKRQPQLILAHGEVTGHSHRIEHPERAELWAFQGVLYLVVLATTRVIHEEHHPITLNPGTYRVWQQREYTPEKIRIVRD
ncbi:MAG: hypothetical protein J2P37_14545 [Ktedonobacteraceae bacterium]|nr:hypothetical protein [Ktedonobacteraceae bacterium]MBO0796647.1 hypothetical protein [Ktedonobacteraceae bacterium]